MRRKDMSVEQLLKKVEELEDELVWEANRNRALQLEYDRIYRLFEASRKELRRKEK